MTDITNPTLKAHTEAAEETEPVSGWAWVILLVLVALAVVGMVLMVAQ